jgi:hypothetical protein
MKRLWTFLTLFACLASPAAASWTGKADFSGCPAGHGLPAGGQESYASQSACEAGIADAKRSLYCGRYWCEEDGAASSGGGGGDDLTQATSKALASGLVNGDSQTFGVGLMGLGAMAILNSGSSQPSAEDVAAQQEAARQRQAAMEAAAAAEAARKKKFEDDKQAALSDMKGGGGDDAHWDDMKDLKDQCCAGSKKVPIIRLKKFDDPLHKDPLPGDSEKFDVLDDWAAAGAYPGTTAMDHESGHIVGCPQGFPYYCGQHCYTEAAFGGHRIPCTHGVLKTTKAAAVEQEMK